MSSEYEARSSERQPLFHTEMGQMARHFANHVWTLVAPWPHFAKDTVGRQWVRCADSVGANLVEGDGRGSEPDAIRFFVIARASLRETEYFLTTAHDRALIGEEDFTQLSAQVDGLLRRINGLINYRRSAKPRIVREARRDDFDGYGVSNDVYDPRFLSPDEYFDNASSPSEL